MKFKFIKVAGASRSLTPYSLFADPTAGGGREVFAIFIFDVGGEMIARTHRERSESVIFMGDHNTDM